MKYWQNRHGRHISFSRAMLIPVYARDSWCDPSLITNPASLVVTNADDDLKFDLLDHHAMIHQFFF